MFLLAISESVILLLIGQLVTLVTLIVNIFYNIYLTNRNRRWDIEDRKVLAAKVVDSAQRVSKQSSMENNLITDAIQVNTEISTKAFHEANQVNNKIESLGLIHNAQEEEKLENIRDSKKDKS